jgi:hypothetical protein
VVDVVGDPGGPADLQSDVVVAQDPLDTKTVEVQAPEELCAGTLEGLTAGLDPHTIIRHPGTPGNAPHLSEIVHFGDYAYVANSFDSITALHRDQGTLVMTLQKPLGASSPRCTTLALHEESLSLFCAAPDRLWPNDGPKVSRITSFDLSAPGEPMIRDIGAVKTDAYYFRDLFVQGNTLYAAAFDEGLLSMNIASDGGLTPPVSVGVDGHIVQVSGAGTKLAVLDSDRGLVLFNGESSVPVEIGVKALNGPLLDLTMNEERLAVAMGSMGAEVYGHADNELTLVGSVQPECVVTGVALNPEGLALTCTSGVYLYSLNTDGPQLKGFVPSRFNMLDLVFWGSGLLVADWEEVAFFSLDMSGSVLLPDIPRGRYIGPGAGAQFPIRNPGDDVMAVDIYFDKPLHRDAKDWKASHTLAPGETRIIQFSPAELDEYMDPLWREAVVRVFSEASVCHKGSFDVGEDQRFGAVKLVERWEMDPATEGHPAIGEAFPQISVEGMNGTESLLPMASVPSYVVFFGWDCAAMWPQLLDLNWLLDHDLVPGGVQPLALSRGAVAKSVLRGTRWRLSNILAGVYHENLGGVLAPGGPIFYGSDLYTKAFFIGDIPGGAEHPTDYLLGEDSRVFAVDKLYRGLWPLRADPSND